MAALRFAPDARLLIALAMAVAPSAGHAANTSSKAALGIEMEAPEGFDDIEQPRELLVDLYFGNRRIGETWIIARPGRVRFRNPQQLLSIIPHVRADPALLAHLSSELDDHSGLACFETNAGRCGQIDPELAEVIFNADRFRLDLFVHPSLLEVMGRGDPYLTPPTAPLSLTSSIGGTIAGSSRAPATYNFQNRTIIGLKNARIRSDSSVASGLGFLFDDLVAEVDTRRHRYSGGLFWAPGVDFTGRRRIAGIGFGTQFDTRADADSLEATPLILFLGQSARVEVLVDGRLVTSASYEAGNNFVDSSALPSGSYPLVLRVREVGGAVREEHRFFVKNAQMAPLGQPIYFAYVGMLADTRRNRPISLSRDLYYQVGAARRLSEDVAVDAAIIGTQKTAMAQVGGWLVTRFARIRAAGLVSTRGDKAALLQLGSSGTSRLNFNFDIRRVWRKGGGPLIPLPSQVENFGSVPPTGAQAADGSYTQASGSLTYSLGQTLLSLTGSYRRDSGSRADYSIGPSLSWPILRRGGLQLVMQADAQKSRNTTATFAGFRLLHTAGGGFSSLATGGYGSLKSRDGGRRSVSRQVGSFSGQWFYQDADHTQIGAEGAVQRDVEATTARANAYASTQLGSARAEFLHSLEGRRGSQYGLSFQTGIALGARAIELGGRDLNQSAIIASVDGSARDVAFDVLIDEVPRGRLGAGKRLPIFLESYKSYSLRLRPVGAAPVNYDSAPRLVTLFPGNVEHLRWNAAQLVTVFGQAVGADGKAIANASITLSRAIGQTDENGYFQVDAEADDVLRVDSGRSGTCKIPLAGLKVEGDYTRLGRVICK